MTDHAAAAKARYERLKASGRCVRCAEPLPEGRHRNLCPMCTQLANEYNKQRRKTLKERRICTRCTTPLPDGWYYMLCPTCRKSINRYMRRYFRRRKEKQNEQR